MIRSVLWEVLPCVEPDQAIHIPAEAVQMPVQLFAINENQSIETLDQLQDAELEQQYCKTFERWAENGGSLVLVLGTHIHNQEDTLILMHFPNGKSRGNNNSLFTVGMKMMIIEQIMTPDETYRPNFIARAGWFASVGGGRGVLGRHV